MALTLATIIAAIRVRHPAFHKRHVPDAALASWLSTYQRLLVSKGVQRNREFLTAQASIAVSIEDANRVGTVGAGTTGRLPAQAGQSPADALQLPMGPAAAIDTSAATELVVPTVVESATADTLTADVAWSVDQWNGKLVEIVSGTGFGQQRFVLDTTADTVQVTESWQVVPDGSSIFRIVDVEDDATTASTTMGAVVAAPFTASRVGYLVKIDATGAPYLDFSSPVVVRYGVGCALPAHHYVLGGTVRFTTATVGDGNEGAPLTLVGFKDRFDGDGDYIARIENGQLWLMGTREDWQDVESIDLRFVPIPPDLTALTSEFMLPDDCDNVLIAGGSLYAGERVNALNVGEKIDLTDLRVGKAEGEAEYLRAASQKKRNRKTIIRASE